MVTKIQITEDDIDKGIQCDADKLTCPIEFEFELDIPQQCL